MTRKEKLADILMTQFKGEKCAGQWDWIISSAINSNVTNGTWRAWADAFWELYEQNRNNGSIAWDKDSGFIYYAGGRINYSPVAA